MTKISHFINLVFFLALINPSLKAEESNCDNAEIKDYSAVTLENKDPSSKSDNNENKSDVDKQNSQQIELKPPRIGNFALPTSQQPAALFGFGGNIIDKDEVQLYLFADDLTGRKKTTVDIIPSVLFGVTDNFSISFYAPFTPLFKDGHNQSNGLEDFYVQLEYAFYNKSTASYTDQATVVANMTVPTGSIKKTPPTGFGAPSFFIGGTYYRTWVDWIAFTSYGAILPTSEHGTKFGDMFLYQMGFGKNLPSPRGWIFAWMVEIDGQYNKKNRINRIIDHNSGGNTIFVTPSFWISSERLLVQFGVSIPINQNLQGRQNKFDYVLNLNCAYSFY